MTEVTMRCSASSGEMTPEEERITIRDIAVAAEANSKEGDTFYLITQRWWQHWIEYVNQEQSNNTNDGSSVTEHGDYVGSSSLKRPAVIDNSDLIYDAASEETSIGVEIHDTLLEGRDYVLLPQEVWSQLYSWYGGGPTLERKVIGSGLSQTELAVEVYPLRLQLHVIPKGGRSTLRISKKETIGELHRKACEIFDLNLEQVCIWDYYGRRKHALMNDMDKTLDDANIQMDQDILVEIVNHVNGTTLAGSMTSIQDNGSSQRETTSFLIEPSKSSLSIAGGLSASKGTSRSNTTELPQIPNLASPVRELDNTYGTIGVSTRGATGGLTGLMNLGNTCFMNSAIQCLVHTPEFARYFREDYHQEINWQNPLGMVGQYKSTLVCPVCNKVSVTFDPFMYLSLPLQPTITRTMTVTVFTCDGSALPYACTVTVPKQGRCRDLIHALSSACSLKHSEKLLLVEIRNHLIQKFLEDPLIMLSTIKDDDYLAAYKMPKLVKNTKHLQLIHRRREQETNDAQTTSGWKPYGTPLVSSISCDDVITRGDIQLLVHKMLSPMARTESLGQTDISDTSVSIAASDQSRDISSGEACTDSSISNSVNKESTYSEAAALLKLPLQLVDESNACIDLSVGEDKPVRLSSSSTSILVYVDWSQKLLDKYDTHYLENLQEVFNGPPNKKARTEPLSLYTCLEAFLREEPLVPEDMWYCPQCEERRQASKKLDLWRLPEVLVIHLKRFSYSRSIKHNKLETFVNFPIHDFDLTNYVANQITSQRQLYELYALTNHYGGMGSGHYTAHIKLLDENRWYNFDDHQVSPINEEEVKTPHAYVLFYRRVKTDGTSASNGTQSCAGYNHSSSQK